MKKNVGTTDRIVRSVVAIAAIILAFVVGATTAWGIVLFVVAAIMVITAASQYCPIYTLTKVNTLRSTKHVTTKR
jgi:hypothetical protein